LKSWARCFTISPASLAEQQRVVLHDQEDVVFSSSSGHELEYCESAAHFLGEVLRSSRLELRVQMADWCGENGPSEMPIVNPGVLRRKATG